ncbi:response regulator transcription factor [Caenimonas sedimenti]|uniref:Response regulator transcription factor n=2 Tax=Caenimonas sedimenti TaxID=2596921 RepID=A0A562ZQ40_9BURK|nr:response regulator transcription factor [Caenimonas sedimenti]
MTNFTLGAVVTKVRSRYARAMAIEPGMQAAESGVTFIIADDHNLVRDGLKLMVSGMLPHVRFLEADDADSLERAANAPQVKLALVDLNMPGMDRGARLAQLARTHPRLPLVCISALTSPDVVRRTLEIPTVHAFVPKSATADHMRVAIDAALQGIKLMFVQPAEAQAAAEIGLSPRLEEVRALLKQGMTNKRIAQKLNISEGTVKNYMTEIFRALNVSNRTQAAQYDPDIT